MNITILGAGAFGTGLAICLARQQLHDITLVTISQEHLEELASHHENKTYFPGYSIPNAVVFSMSIPANTDILLSCAPAQATLDVGDRLSKELDSKVPIVFCSKGILAQKSHFITEIAKENLSNPLFVLSGPTFAHELAKGLPSAIMLAGADLDQTKVLAQHLNSSDFKVVAHDDPIGLQVAGSMKNVIAIANGIFLGRGLGQNASAALLTQGIREMIIFAQNFGGKKETFYGLAGMGDLILTCSNKASRNMAFGFALGEGTEFTGHAVVEGVHTAKTLHAIKDSLDLPVCDMVYSIVHEKFLIENAITRMLNHPHYLA